MVSIPSSSGHQFTAARAPRLARHGTARFQSLLHQGISLLQRPLGHEPLQPVHVSIPSSSGHQFTEVVSPPAVDAR